MATIIQFCLSSNCGGMETYVERISRALSQRGHRLQVVTSAGSYLARRLPPEMNCSLMSRGIRDAARLAQEVARKVLRNRADVVHVHGGRELPYAIMAKLCCRHRMRVIYSRHIVFSRPKKDPWHRLLYRHVDAYLAVSAQVRDQVLRFVPIPAERVHLLHHGTRIGSTDAAARTAARASLGIDDAAFVAGAFSRLEYRKGQHTLIEAADLLYRAGIDMQLLIVGHAVESDYKESLTKRVRNLDLGARVAFVEFVPDAHLLMIACDVVVVPSKEEGFGLVVIEAMAAGVPVICTRGAGGVLDLIEHEQNGLLFDWENAAMLAQQLRALYQNSHLRVRLGSNGHDLAKRHFNFEDHVDALEVHFRGRPGQ